MPTLEQDDYLRLFYTIAHALLVFTLATMPTLVLNAPVGVIARVVSSREQKKALAASRVKIEAKDVVMSKKITLSIVLVPTLWITYAVLLLKYTSLRPETVLVLFLCCPLFSYIGVMATEAGMVDFKDIKVRHSSYLHLPHTRWTYSVKLQHNRHSPWSCASSRAPASAWPPFPRSARRCSGTSASSSTRSGPSWATCTRRRR